MRINADLGQHIGMHHAAAEHLQPAALAHDIDLRRRLRERKIGRAKAHFERLFKEDLQEINQQALELGKGHGLIHDQALDLMKHRGVGHIRVAAINPARRDKAKRRPGVFHDPDLHRRGMRAQQAPVGKVKGVVHGARGMMFRDIQGAEVMIIVFYLRPLDDIETDLLKQRRDAPQGQRDRVPARGAHATARQGRVQPALFNGLFERRVFQRFFSAVQRLLDKLLGPVEPLPGFWPLGGGQAAQLFELFREPAFPAQIIDPGLLKPGQAGRGLDRREGLGLELFDIVQSCSPGGGAA